MICSFPEDIYEIAESFLRQDDIILIEKNGLHQGAQAQRLPKPPSHRPGADFSTENKEVRLCGGPASDDRHGLLGEPGPQTEIQEKCKKSGTDRSRAKEMC